jgi:uncharacterized protein YggE
MNKFIFLLFGCFIISHAASQSTERFIRIVGNSKKEYTATGVALSITIAEQQPNEYKQIKYRPFETVYAEYVAELNKLGIPENQLVRNPKNLGKFTQTVTREYSLRLNDFNQLEKLAAVQIGGVGITDIKYTYGALPSDTEENLAKAAIDDASRKAKRLCEEMGMKLGKILNIEDSSSGCCNEIDDQPANKVTRAYKVNVTFELMDK